MRFTGDSPATPWVFSGEASVALWVMGDIEFVDGVIPGIVLNSFMGFH